MPTLDSHPSQTATKLLAVGDSGTGKTGALASLVEAGYTLGILDFDNGLDVLVNAIKSYNNPSLLKHVYYETLVDKTKMIGGQLVCDGIPNAYTRAVDLMKDWPGLGPLDTWDESRILVLDSLTFLSKAAFRWVEVVLHPKDGRQTYGEAQKRVENTLALLYSPAIKCNVIVNTHVVLVDINMPSDMPINPDADGNLQLVKAYPSSIGKALSPNIPRYFNTVLEYRSYGGRRVISTVPTGMINVKTSVLPSSVPRELPLETGLATLFKALQGVPKLLTPAQATK